MSAPSTDPSDPFADHQAVEDDERTFVTDSTLSVGRNATLTLGTDALIVLDEGLHDGSAFNCCGLLPTKSTSTRAIPYFNILWASLSKVDITIHYAKPTSRSSSSHAVRVSYINYALDLSIISAHTFANSWTSRLLDRAYGSSQRNKRIKILINPCGGVGKAVKSYTSQIEPILAAAHCEVDIERTAYSGHATEIAEKLDVNAYDVLASCSGDGLPFECFNGLAKKPNAAEALRKIAVVQFPCGSGNAMSWNLNGTGDCSMAALCVVKGHRTPLDLCSVTQGEKRTISFLSQSVGIVAESDLGTDNIRWMGDSRFTYGFLVRLLGKTLYPCDIAVKTEIEHKKDIKKHYAAHRANKNDKHETEYRSSSSLTSSTTSRRVEGLPPLKYGTVNSPLPPPGQESGWTPLTPYDNLGNFYAGNMSIMAENAPFFPSSLPADGMMDLVTIDGDIGRMTSLNLLLSVSKSTFFDNDCVRVRKIVAYRVVPRFGKWAESQHGQSASKLGRVLKIAGLGSDGHGNRDGGYISIDGEKYPFEPFQVEVHRGLGTVLSRSGRFYESPGPMGWEDLVSNQDSATVAQA